MRVRRRLRSNRGRLLATTLAGGILIALLAVDLWVLSRPEELRARALEALQAALHPDAHVRIGPARLLFPDRVVVEDVRIWEAGAVPEASDPVVTIARVELEVDLPLFAPRRVTIAEPTIRLRADADWVFDVPALAASDDAGSGGSDGSGGDGAERSADARWDELLDGAMPVREDEIAIGTVRGHVGPFDAFHLQADASHELVRSPLSLELDGDGDGRVAFRVSASDVLVDDRVVRRIPAAQREKISPLGLSARVDVDALVQHLAAPTAGAGDGTEVREGIGRAVSILVEGGQVIVSQYGFSTTDPDEPDEPEDDDGSETTVSGAIVIHDLRFEVPLNPEAEDLHAAPKWPVGPLHAVVTFDPWGAFVQELSGKAGPGEGASIDARATVVFATRDEPTGDEPTPPSPIGDAPVWPPPGGAHGPSFYAHATFRDVALDDTLRDSLPYETVVDWNDFGISGFLDVELTAFNRPGEDKVHQYLRILPRGRGHANPPIFPLTLRNFRGYIEVQDETKYFKGLKGDIKGGGTIEIGGAVLGLNWIKRAFLRIEDAAFTQDLFDALEPDESEIAQAFRPTGTIDAEIKISQEPGQSIQPHTRVDVAGAWGDFEDFTWPFEIASGALEVVEGEIRVLEVVGLGRSAADSGRDGMVFKANGTLSTKMQVVAGGIGGGILGAAGKEFGFGPEINLTIKAKNVPIGPQLIAGLGPEVSEIIDRFAPAGRVDAIVTVKKAASEIEAYIDVTMTPIGSVTLVPGPEVPLPLAWRSGALKIQVALDPKHPDDRTVTVDVDGLGFHWGPRARVSGAIAGGLGPIAASVVGVDRLRGEADGELEPRRMGAWTPPSMRDESGGDDEPVLLARGTVRSQSLAGRGAERDTVQTIEVDVAGAAVPLGPALVRTLPVEVRDQVAALDPDGPADVLVRIREVPDGDLEVETRVRPLGASVAVAGLGLEGEVGRALAGRRLQDLHGLVIAGDDGTIDVRGLSGVLHPSDALVTVAGQVRGSDQRLVVGLRALPVGLALQALPADTRDDVIEDWAPSGVVGASVKIIGGAASPAGTSGLAAGGVGVAATIAARAERASPTGTIIESRLVPESLAAAVDVGGPERMVVRQIRGHLDFAADGLRDVDLTGRGPEGEEIVAQRVFRKPLGPQAPVALRASVGPIRATGQTMKALPGWIKSLLAQAEDYGRISVGLYTFPSIGGRGIRNFEIRLDRASVDVGTVLRDVRGPIHLSVITGANGEVIRVEGSIDGARAFIGKGRSEADGLHADFRFEEGVLTVERLKARFLGGLLTGTVTVRPGEDKVRYEGRLQLEGAFLSELRTGTNGRIAADVSFRSGDEGFEGEGDLHLTDAEIAKFPGFVNVLRVLSLTPAARGSNTGDIFVEAWDAFREVNLDFKLDKDGLEIDRIDMLSTGLALYGRTGRVTWDGELQGVRLFVPIGGRPPIPGLDWLMEMFQRKLLFEVSVNGPIDDPTVEAYPLSAITKPIRDLFGLFGDDEGDGDGGDGDGGGGDGASPDGSDGDSTPNEGRGP